MRKSLPDTDSFSIRLKGKQWWVRKRLPSGQRLERGLGTANRSEAMRRGQKVVHEHLKAEHLTAWGVKVTEGLRRKGWLWRMNINASTRIKKKGGKIDLQTLEAIALRSGGYCEVSGIPFYLGDEKRHPFKPSLDRINSQGGYDPWNLRMVLMTVNYCMSTWGEKVFLQISAAILAKHLENIASGWGLNGGAIIENVEKIDVTT